MPEAHQARSSPIGLVASPYRRDSNNVLATDIATTTRAWICDLLDNCPFLDPTSDGWAESINAFRGEASGPICEIIEEEVRAWFLAQRLASRLAQIQ